MAQYDKKLPPKPDDDVKNEFHIDITMDMLEIKVSITDAVTGLEWFGHYMPNCWTGKSADAENIYNFIHAELEKEPANWVQLPPFKNGQPLNIIIGDSNSQNYKLSVPFKQANQR